SYFDEPLGCGARNPRDGRIGWYAKLKRRHGPQPDMRNQKGSRDGGGVATVEHKPYEDPTRPQRLHRRTDLVVDNRVLDAPRAAVPVPDVAWQEDLIEPVRFGPLP